MIDATIPDNEPIRLATLHTSQLLHSRGNEQFNRLTRLGRRLLQMPICQLNLVDAEHIQALAAQGLDSSQQPRHSAFCAYTILGDDALVVQDTRHHPYFYDHPLVQGAAGIRCYVGMPLRAFNGCKVATLCLMDKVPREISADDLAALKDLALLTEQELAMAQLAVIDELTALVNRRGFETMARLVLNTTERQGLPAMLLQFELTGIAPLVLHYGQAEADRQLLKFSTLLRQTFRNCDVIGRLGETEFAVLLANSSAEKTAEIVERLRQSALAQQQQSGCSLLQFNVAAVHAPPSQTPSLEHLLSRADRLIYQRQQGQQLC